MRWLWLLALATLLMADDDRNSLQHWREKYERQLTSESGWLAVTGLYWLHEGENRVGADPQSEVVLPAGQPKVVGVLSLHNGEVRFTNAIPLLDKFDPKTPLKPDRDRIHLPGATSFMVLLRDRRYAVRVWDGGAPTIREFKGLHWYPADEKARITARWTAYPVPKKVQIPTILKFNEESDIPGYAEFEWDGKTWKVEPVIEGDHLFLMFRDQTAGKETYGAGRYLTVEMPKDGNVILDFNKARNPPCAFTAFATCPIPPKQNWIGARIEAGEKKYSSH